LDIVGGNHGCHGGTYLLAARRSQAEPL
jgi:hypothetical protein